MKTLSLPTNYIHRSLGRFALLAGLVLLVCFGLSPGAQAVNPAPDGCYPNFTTAEGCNALQSLATGLGNTGVGWDALFATSIGSYNTAVGAGALLSNAGDQNTATGVGALLLNTSGTQNTANGAFALYNNSAGSGNIAIGYQAGSALTNGNNNIAIGNIGLAGESNTIRIGEPAIHAAIFLGGITAMSPEAPNQAVLLNPATGQLGSADISSFGVVSTDPENTAVGDQALVSNTGASNTATGFRSLFSNTTGDENTATGAHALENNETSLQNCAFGTNALVFNGFGVSGADFNDAFGAFALFNNSTGFSNNAFGNAALQQNISGAANTAVGDLALENNDISGTGTASGNTAVGALALVSNRDGYFNNAFGYNALGGNDDGLFNQAMGADALSANVSGASNVVIGDSAAVSNANGSFNTIVGDMAGQDITDGHDNIYIGATAGSSAGDESSTIRIGDPGFVTACYVAGISGQIASGGVQVFITGNGKLGTLTSSARFKDDIKPMANASESILALKPVTFRYKGEIDPEGVPQFGLVAEEVEKVNPDLVARDADGKAYTVRYEAVNAMLLNEFLKEHKAFVEEQRKVQEQGATIARLEKQIVMLTAGLQKVSAQLELSKSAPQPVLNNQ